MYKPEMRYESLNQFLRQAIDEVLLAKYEVPSDIPDYPHGPETIAVLNKNINEKHGGEITIPTIPEIHEFLISTQSENYQMNLEELTNLMLGKTVFTIPPAIP